MLGDGGWEGVGVILKLCLVDSVFQNSPFVLMDALGARLYLGRDYVFFPDMASMVMGVVAMCAPVPSF